MAEKKINNTTYKVEKLNAVASLKLLGRLVKILGPGMREINGIFDLEEAARDAAFFRVLASIVESMNPDDFTALVVEVSELAQVKMNGAYEPLVFEVHVGDLLEGFKIFTFVLETNYKSFFGEASQSTLGRKILASQTRSSDA